MTFGEKTKALRKAKGETLRQTAAAVNVSAAHMCEVEKGTSKNPSYNLVRALAAHFGVTSGSLMEDGDVVREIDWELARVQIAGQIMAQRVMVSKAAVLAGQQQSWAMEREAILSVDEADALIAALRKER